MDLILASASPRRVELLTLLGLSFAQLPADIDESYRAPETPAEYVERMALEKASAIAVGASAGAVVIGADTTVLVDEQILGKPQDEAEGLAMLQLLSGRSHRVLTGLCVLHGAQQQLQCIESEVWFRTISAEEARRYWATGEPADKAGGYGIQGIGSIFVERIAGSYSGVMGLPLAALEAQLRGVGFDIWTYTNRSAPPDQFSG